MSEKLCLKWNDFQENINQAFRSLRSDSDFCDVTLACEDGQQIDAHKVILAASSPFFQTLLKRNKHPHPLIYMRGVKSEDLVAIVDFLYYGQANVYQDNIDSFLAIAEEVSLKGLAGKVKSTNEANATNQIKAEFNHRTDGSYEQNTTSETTDAIASNDSVPEYVTITDKEELEAKVISLKKSRRKVKSINEANETNHIKAEFNHSTDSFYEQNTTSETTDAIATNYSVPEYVTITDTEELEAKVKSMMEKSSNCLPNKTVKADMCTVCGKEGQGGSIKDHIEANHLEGVSLPCNFCGKTFRSRNRLRKHNASHH